jgi:hypothetical protein
VPVAMPYPSETLLISGGPEANGCGDIRPLSQTYGAPG